MACNIRLAVHVAVIVLRRAQRSLAAAKTASASVYEIVRPHEMMASSLKSAQRRTSTSFRWSSLFMVSILEGMLSRVATVLNSVESRPVQRR
jgi:hypothetical protein